METVKPSPPVDFNFDSSCTTPYISAPSSPQRFGTSLSTVPTSFHGGAVPFSWEEKPGIPKFKHTDDEDINEEDNGGIDDGYVFEFSGPLEKTYFSAADELFDSGKIKPLKPPPHGDIKTGEKQIGNNYDIDRLAHAAARDQRRRGREVATTRPNNPRHKATRSLSPLRASDLVFDHRKQSSQLENTNNNSFTSNWCLSTMLSGKWKLKDLLLFRSASEGRASSTQKMNKYATLKNNKKVSREEAQSWSSKYSIESEGSGSISRRRGPVSAHEMHYTINRTISEELKRKTFLPYKHGLLGCLGFNPPAVHEFSSRGFSSMSMPPRS